MKNNPSLSFSVRLLGDKQRWTVFIITLEKPLCIFSPTDSCVTNNNNTTKNNSNFKLNSLVLLIQSTSRKLFKIVIDQIAGSLFIPHQYVFENVDQLGNISDYSQVFVDVPVRKPDIFICRRHARILISLF